jgi:hypothetical protein
MPGAAQNNGQQKCMVLDISSPVAWKTVATHSKNMISS